MSKIFSIGQLTENHLAHRIVDLSDGHSAEVITGVSRNKNGWYVCDNSARRGVVYFGDSNYYSDNALHKSYLSWKEAIFHRLNVISKHGYSENNISVCTPGKKAVKKKSAHHQDMPIGISKNIKNGKLYGFMTAVIGNNKSKYFSIAGYGNNYQDALDAAIRYRASCVNKLYQENINKGHIVF